MAENKLDDPKIEETQTAASPKPKRTRVRRSSTASKSSVEKSETELLEESFALVAAQGEALVHRFYNKLFEDYPELVPLFEGVSVVGQEKKLLASLVLLVQNLHKPDVLKEYLTGLGARHAHYGVEPEDYAKVAETLLSVMAEFAGDGWTDEVQLAWHNTLNNVATIMLDAYEPVEADEMEATQSTNQELIELKAMVNGSMTPMMRIDRDFNITFVNQATVDMLKEYESVLQQVYPSFSADNLVGQNIDQYHKNPMHQRRLLNDPNNLPYSTDIQVGPLRFNLNVTAVMSDEGDYLGNALEWSNVTEQREKEEQVLRLSSTIEGAKTAIMMIDRDFNVTYANQSTLDMLREHEEILKQQFPGFSVDKLVGSNIDQYHKDPQHQRRLLADPANLPYNTDIKVGPLSFNLNVTAIHDLEGNYIGTGLEWANNTDAKNQIAAYEGQLDAISKAMGVISFNMDGTITTINDNFLSVVGYAKDEVIGQHHRMFAEPELAASAEYTDFWAKLNRGEFVSGQFKRVGKGGREIWLQASYNPILDINGKPYQVVKYATDITAQKQLQTTIESILEETSLVMNSMAEGDLTKQISGVYDGEFAQLKEAINTTVSKLLSTVTEIEDTTATITTAASEISQGNLDLSQRTEEQASSLEETAASMEELTSTVRQNSDNAAQANQLAASAREQAEKGGSVIKSAIDAMTAISQSSRKVADIIGVIDEIAFQTNLLALNAAVEAARAGDQGRGFAVVASEVRNLAQRSAAAAKEIKELINDSGEKVKEGSMLVDESGRTLEDIVNGAKKVGDIISEIAAAGSEQTEGIGQVNNAITQMDQMTQQNAALVEQAAAASQSLDEQGKNLQRLVSFFETGQQASAPQPTAVNTGLNMQQTPAAPVRKPAAPQPAAQSDDEWDEF
jgi:methyl-accepting chemotaxis protein